ncbi:MAG: acyl-CoA synthetase [Pseudomonadota bacterium]|nr:acyl-CoA synthetase [Pseudomonadota bacterium]
MTVSNPSLPPEFCEIPDRLNIAGELIDKINTRGFGKRTAFVWDDGCVTFGDLADRVNRLCHGLATAGVTPGMSVLVWMHNCHEFVETLLAVMKVGAIPIFLNSQLGDEEVGYVIAHSDAQVAFTLSSLTDPLLKFIDTLPLGVFVARGAPKGTNAFEMLTGDDPGDPFPTAQTKSDDPAFMIYTSGTTGRPKGIVHAHRWVIALGNANIYRLPVRSEDRIYATGEWSFISALGHNVIFPMRNGVTAVILEGRPTAENVLKTIERHRPTLMYSVATVYRRILAIDEVEDLYDFSSLRGCNATGEALEATTWHAFKDRIGCEIWEHYGVSEMQMVLGQGPRQPVRPGSIGVTIPGTHVEVLDEKYRKVPPGKIGHLMIAAQNPGFFIEYHKDPEKTAEVVHDGWYHTGDLAWQDEDGFFWVAGREDDCFKSRGIFISPYEIENILRQHPAIIEACVVPRSDSEIGNRIRAVCVLKAGTKPTKAMAEEIRASVRMRIAPYKTPHIIEFAEYLPKSPVGKILRRELTP